MYEDVDAGVEFGVRDAVEKADEIVLDERQINVGWDVNEIAV